MDTTLSNAKNRLADRLTELGRRLDSSRDPAEMRRLIAARKVDQAKMAVLRAADQGARQ